MSFCIRKDTKRDTVRAVQSFTLPITGGPNLPRNVIESIGGGLLYNNATKLPYYNDGKQWRALGGSKTVINTYALVMTGGQPIPSSTDSIIRNLEATMLPYHDDTGSWNLQTGVYTASSALSLMLSVTITWAEDTSTVGRRFVKFIYKQPSSPSMVVKEVVTQPDPNISIKTTQEATMMMKLKAGDQVWVRVRQTSGAPLDVSGGAETSISGFETVHE